MTVEYRFRDNVNDITFNNDTSSANYINVQRSVIKTTGDLQRSKLTLTLPGDYAGEHPWREYIANAYGLGNVRLDLQDRGVVLGGGWGRKWGQSWSSPRERFTGYLFNVKTTTTAIILEFSTLLSLANAGEGRKFQRACPYTLFDPKTCKADINDASGYVGIVTAIDPTRSVINLNVGPIGHENFVNGVMTFNGLSYWIGAITPNGRQFTLRSPVRDNTFKVGSFVGALPPCDKTLTTCTVVFGNAENFGGMPLLPHGSDETVEDEAGAANFSKDIISSAEQPVQAPKGIYFYEADKPNSLAGLDGTNITGDTYSTGYIRQFDLSSLKESSPELFPVPDNEV